LVTFAEASAGDWADVTLFVVRAFIEDSHTSNHLLRVRFNGDDSSNYAYRFHENASTSATDAINTSSLFPTFFRGSGTSFTNLRLSVTNSSTRRSIAEWTAAQVDIDGDDLDVASRTVTGAGSWNGGLITSIALSHSTVGTRWQPGSWFELLGLRSA